MADSTTTKQMLAKLLSNLAGPDDPGAKEFGLKMQGIGNSIKDFVGGFTDKNYVYPTQQGPQPVTKDTRSLIAQLFSPMVPSIYAEDDKPTQFIQNLPYVDPNKIPRNAWLDRFLNNGIPVDNYHASNESIAKARRKPQQVYLWPKDE